MRVMYDSVNPSKIPPGTTIVAGYINGAYKWSDAGWARFPGSVKVRIQIYIPGTIVVDDGDVLDIESSDVNPASRAVAIRWIEQRRAAGIVPTIYTSKSGLLYLGGLNCDYWIADPGLPHLLPGTMATQYVLDSPYGYDLSLVADGWPRKVGDPVPNGKQVCVRLTADGQGYWCVGSDGGVFTFGTAQYYGSLPELKIVPNAPVNCFDVLADGSGYIMGGEDWGVYAFGAAKYLGHPQ